MRLGLPYASLVMLVWPLLDYFVFVVCHVFLIRNAAGAVFICNSLYDSAVLKNVIFTQSVSRFPAFFRIGNFINVLTEAHSMALPGPVEFNNSITLY
jgi:hypothetical protein